MLSQFADKKNTLVVVFYSLYVAVSSLNLKTEM